MVAAAVAPIAAIAIATPALATGAISGIVYPSGKAQLSNVALTRTVTIIGTQIDGKSYCIHNATTHPVMCRTEGSLSRVGQTQPRGTGYFAIAESYLRGGVSQVTVTWHSVAAAPGGVRRGAQV